VISHDVCGCFNKRVSVNIGCCGVLGHRSNQSSWSIFIQLSRWCMFQ